jgi:hypothetical protein
MLMSKNIIRIAKEKINLKNYLLLSNVFLIIFSIACFNLGLLPLKNPGDFIFLLLIAFLFALYRPGWTFLFFAGFIILETVSLSPEETGIKMRPYQILGALGLIAIGVRLFSKRLNFDLPKICWSDWALAMLALSGFASALSADDKMLAFKQSAVIISLFGIYVFSRTFIQNSRDIKKILPFFLSSSFVVVLYSVWQNWRFIRGKSHFETMPGRPNGTFTEADWLGIFLVFLLSALYPIAYNFYKNIDFYEIKYRIGRLIEAIFVWLMIIFSTLALIITVSRSAWLGAGAVFAIFSFYVLKEREYKMLGMVLSGIILSLALVYILNLTNFELFNRLQSTGSGNQEITVSCDRGSDVPRSIVRLSQLSEFNCRHIDLEDVEREKSEGRVITRAYRDDPNVSIRKEIYEKSLNEIKNSPVLGIGWGNISGVLGTDERGSGLNSSNIFLEVWLGAGIIGLIAFLVFLGNIFYRSLKADKEWKLFLQLSLAAILIPNLFNAGIMLGFLWFWLAISQIKE